MKRPILWCGIWFAVGELIYLLLYGWLLRVFLVAIVLVLLYIGGKRVFTRWMIVLSAISCFVGFINVYRIDLTRSLERWFDSGNKSGVCRDIDIETYGKDMSKNLDVVIIGKVVDINQKSDRYIYTMRVYETKLEGYVIDERYKVNVQTTKEDYKIGQTVIAKGKLSPYERSSNYGAFDAYTYYLSKGISFRLKSTEIELVDTKYNILLQNIYDIKQKSKDNLYSIAGPKYGALISGILLGEKGDIDGDTKSLYTLCGMAHILAISGLHIALIGMIVFNILQMFRIPKALAGVVSICLLVMYGVLCGFSNSCIRAVVMLSISTIAKVKGKRYDAGTALSLSMLLMLMVNPYKIYDQGVWLSFGAIIALILFSIVKKRFDRSSAGLRLKLKAPVRMKIVNMAVSSVFVNIITAPIVCYIYYGFSIVGIITNLMVIPLMTFVVGFGILGLFVSYFDYALAQICLFPCIHILKFYDWLCVRVSKLPLGYVNVGRVKPIWLVIYYVLVFCVFLLFSKKSKKYRKLIKLALMVCIMFLTFCTVKDIRYKRSDKLIMVDVGQGECVLVRVAGQNILVDCGSTTSQGDSVALYDLIPTLRYYAMTRIDAAILSHPDEDHINGLLSLIEKKEYYGINIESIILPSRIDKNDNYYRLIGLAESEGICIEYISKGDKLYLDNIYMECLYPEKSCGNGLVEQEEAFEGSETNQNSLVLFIKTKYEGVLLTGDVEKNGLDQISRDYKNLLNSVTILDLPHHGSKNSLSTDFYQVINPKVAIISAGANNRYGHPHKEIIEILNELKCDIYRTDKNGAIVIELEK